MVMRNKLIYNMINIKRNSYVKKEIVGPER